MIKKIKKENRNWPTAVVRAEYKCGKNKYQNKYQGSLYDRESVYLETMNFFHYFGKKYAVYISKFMKYIKSTDITHHVTLPIIANISRYNLITLQSNYDARHQ